MSIQSIEISKRLRKQGERLGRDGLSQRVHALVSEYMKKYPNGHYAEAIQLAGRLHAIYLATDPNDYWREVADRGFRPERYDLEKFQKKEPPHASD